MRRASFALGILLIVSLSLPGCGGEKRQSSAQEKAAVTQLVEKFGARLKKVSLLAPKEMVAKSIQENYGDLVLPSLLAEWKANPLNAPGRLTSSPWPERIEIVSAGKTADQEYAVRGKIIEVTSVEEAKGGYAARRSIDLMVGKARAGWRIKAVVLGDYEVAGALSYRNPRYGFSFSLPQSWRSYSIVEDKWEGLAIGGPSGENVVQTGPLILIRHPKWTPENKRQDIPIMIFTFGQWESLQREEFHIGAAPVGPSELGRNTRYIFALPARYNYAFPAGYEEVEEILKSKPLRGIELTP